MTCAIGATRAEKAHVSPFRLDEPSPPCWGRFFMEIPARCLAFLCVLFLTACGSSDASLREESGEAAPKSRFPLAGVSVDDLYFEAVRLHSRGLLSREKMDALQRSLDQMDDKAGGDEQERLDLYHSLLTAFLRRNLQELRAGEYAAQLEAEEEGRGYARRLNEAGVREAERYAENTVLIAGVLGVPTSQEEMVLMVAVPVGGYIVVRVAGVAFKRVPLLLRHMRSADDLVDEARRLGVRPNYVATREEMRALAGEVAARVADAPPAHVGAAKGPKGQGKLNVWNPSNRKDNCTACVSAVIHNSLKGFFEHTADDIERVFEYTGRERGLTAEDSLKVIEKSTGLLANRKPVSMTGSRAVVGHYAVMTRWEQGQYNHVVYGRVTPTGRVVIFDPQRMKKMDYDELLRDYGRSAPYLLEAP